MARVQELVSLPFVGNGGSAISLGLGVWEACAIFGNSFRGIVGGSERTR